ncbi:MAG TPA: pantoate--beta-alanine ligase [Alphaproteobacteria bacterium]|nr:pantoate--beta-alanine ligase [Alphaproteobacteria bacterium]
MWITGDSADLRTATSEWRDGKASIGFVPTMGALHEGHLALVHRARQENDKVVVSLFVNPTQFGPNEDLARYPRTPEEDAQFLGASGVDLLYMPRPEDMYAPGFCTFVNVKGITDHLCGPFRPGHFEGVATVVAKLLLRVNATRAYFGEKDWQQLQVVKALARDLDIPTEIIGLPTVREEDGLALSSRNRYLSAQDRQTAALIPATLQESTLHLQSDPQAVEAVLKAAREKLTAAGFQLDYFECADAESCAPVRTLKKPARLFVAARLGGTRLIDNWAV